MDLFDNTDLNKNCNISQFYHDISNETIDVKIYQNTEVQSLCRRVQILRTNWARLNTNELMFIPASNIITAVDISDKLKPETVKLSIHIRGEETCRRFNQPQIQPDLIKYQQNTEQKEKLAIIEIDVVTKIKPMEIVNMVISENKNNTCINEALQKLALTSSSRDQFVLRFKDIAEYLIHDLPIQNYITFQKLVIDNKVVHLELCSLTTIDSTKHQSEDFDDTIYTISVNFINRDNELIKANMKILTFLKKITNYFIILHLYNQYCSPADNFMMIHRKYSKTVHTTIDDFIRESQLEDIDPQTNANFIKHITNLLTYDPERAKKLGFIETINSEILIILSNIPTYLRNFATKKYFLHYKGLWAIKTKNETPTTNILKIIYSELVSMMQIFYSAMSCKFNQLLSFINPNHFALLNNKHPPVSPDLMTFEQYYRFHIHSIFNVSHSCLNKHTNFILKVKLMYCSRSIGIENQTEKMDKSNYLSSVIPFDKTLAVSMILNQIRRDMCLMFNLYGFESGVKKKLAIGFMNLFDENFKLISGDILIALIPVEFSTKLKVACKQPAFNRLSHGYPYIHITIPSIDKSKSGDFDFRFQKSVIPLSVKSYYQVDEMENIIKSLSKLVITRNYKNINIEAAKKIWDHRNKIILFKSENSLIPLILSSGIITEGLDDEFETFLNSLPTIPTEDCVLMLGPSFSHHIVRKYAVQYISIINTESFISIVTILTNALSYEVNLWNNFMCLLIQRSWDNPQIAHKVFWQCKLLSDDTFSLFHYSVLMAIIICTTTVENKENLASQLSLIKYLSHCGHLVQKCTDDTSKMITLKTNLNKINNGITRSFSLPICMTTKVDSIDISKCKVFKSASSPILVNFTNSFPCGENISVIFKVGDVLSRDMVTIYVFQMLNKVWFKSGIDLKMRIYDVLPTSQLEGLIEVVPSATTLGEIHHMFGLTGTFKSECILDWIKANNPDKPNYDKAIENFLYSCAGYCVATYILGICDRHNDNILLLQSGHIFHIDFNKYMGDAQLFLGFKRDRAPFVLTPDMMEVINQYSNEHGSGYQVFSEICCIAYQIARRNANPIINSVALLLAADPNVENCIEYLYDRLKLDISESDAYVEFYKLIEKSIKTVFTQVNFFIHNVAQKRGERSMQSVNAKQDCLFKFCSTFDIYSKHTDDEIFKIVGVDHINKKATQTRIAATYIIFKIERGNKKKILIYRSLEDIIDLINKLEEIENYNAKSFMAMIKLVKLTSQNYIKENHIPRVLYDTTVCFNKILSSNIKDSNILYTWCHSYSEDEAMFPLKKTNSCDLKQKPNCEIKISFQMEDDKLCILLTSIKNFSSLGQQYADFIIECEVIPSCYRQTSKKKSITSDSFILENFKIPSFSKGHGAHTIKLYLKAVSLFSKKLFGTVIIRVAEIDFSKMDGDWYLVHPAMGNCSN